MYLMLIIHLFALALNHTTGILDMRLSIRLEESLGYNMESFEPTLPM